MVAAIERATQEMGQEEHSSAQQVEQAKNRPKAVKKEDYEKFLVKMNSLLLENFELKQKTHQI